MSGVFHNATNSTVSIPDITYLVEGNKRPVPLTFGPYETKDLEELGLSPRDLQKSSQIRRLIERGTLKFGPYEGASEKSTDEPAPESSEENPKTSAEGTVPGQDDNKTFPPDGDGPGTDENEPIGETPSGDVDTLPEIPGSWSSWNKDKVVELATAYGVEITDAEGKDKSKGDLIEELSTIRDADQGSTE